MRFTEDLTFMFFLASLAARHLFGGQNGAKALPHG
jgi:hypothetical protein